MAGVMFAALAADPLSAQERSVPDAAAAQAADDPAAAAHPAILAGQRDGQRMAAELLGASVVNAAGEEIGTVDDLVISRDGNVAGVVVALGGVMGLGARNVGIAWDRISFDPGGLVEIETLTDDELEAAPEFRKTSDGAARRPPPDGAPQSLAGPAPD